MSILLVLMRLLLMWNLRSIAVAPDLSAFVEYGLPRVIRTDNGTPFVGARSPAGLSTLSAWWVRLGVTPERIMPASPWENGAFLIRVDGKFAGMALINTAVACPTMQRSSTWPSSSSCGGIAVTASASVPPAGSSTALPACGKCGRGRPTPPPPPSGAASSDAVVSSRISPSTTGAGTAGAALRQPYKRQISVIASLATGAKSFGS